MEDSLVTAVTNEDQIYSLWVSILLHSILQNCLQMSYITLHTLNGGHQIHDHMHISACRLDSFTVTLLVNHLILWYRLYAIPYITKRKTDGRRKSGYYAAILCMNHLILWYTVRLVYMTIINNRIVAMAICTQCRWVDSVCSDVMYYGKLHMVKGIDL